MFSQEELRKESPRKGWNEEEMSAGPSLHLPLPEMKRFCAACLLAATAIAQPAAAQWGVLYPDGSIRGQGGILLDGPNPSRILQQQMTLPINRYTIDPSSGTIYRGGIMQSGPSPSRSLAICMQLGIC
jgi:hypothetical protein